MSRRRNIQAQKTQAEYGLSEEMLMAYLEQKLRPDERRHVEEMLSREGMEGDALEGLLSLDSGEIHQMRGELNASLHGMLKKRRRRRGITGQRWALLAVILILLMAILGYWVIFLMQKGAY